MGKPVKVEDQINVKSIETKPLESSPEKSDLIVATDSSPEPIGVQVQDMIEILEDNARDSKREKSGSIFELDGTSLPSYAMLPDHREPSTEKSDLSLKNI